MYIFCMYQEGDGTKQMEKKNQWKIGCLAIETLCACLFFAVVQGWLVDMINKFGMLGGFQILQSRFQRNLSVSLIAALIRLVTSIYYGSYFFTCICVPKSCHSILDSLQDFFCDCSVLFKK